MDPAFVQDLPVSQLARLLDPATLPGWSDADAGVVLQHQLAAPLLPDLLIVPGAEAQRLQSLIACRENAASFLTQLTSVHPSAELLEAIKRFARHMRDDTTSPLHGPSAIVLYYAAIAAALIRGPARITQLSDDQMIHGFSWAAQRQGAKPLQTLFEMAIATLRTADGPTPAP